MRFAASKLTKMIGTVSQAIFALSLEIIRMHTPRIQKHICLTPDAMKTAPQTKRLTDNRSGP
jgi:hypothetical protein